MAKIKNLKKANNNKNIRKTSNVKKNKKNINSNTKPSSDSDFKLNISKKTIQLFFAACLFVIVFIFIFQVMTNNDASRDSSGFFGSSVEVVSGDRVAVWYSGRLKNGELFDTNIQEIALNEGLVRSSFTPLEFVVGAAQMIRGFDQALIGMKIGEKKTVTIPSSDAYGPYYAELVEEIPLDEFEVMIGEQIDESYLGLQIIGSVGDRQTVGTISTIGVNFVRIDFNHELAGKDLVFEIELISIDRN
ncbi:MAG: FKBP-type peptidyl-prolyl cis-trans isomerase [Candidatus Woesearchaeota archaeon]